MSEGDIAVNFKSTYASFKGRHKISQPACVLSYHRGNRRYPYET